MAASSVPKDSEEGRAFLQERLALFGKCAILTFLGVGALGLMIMTLNEGAWWSRMRAPPWHLLALSGVALPWLVCRRGTRSVRTLTVLDAVVTVTAGVGFALLVAIAPPELISGVPATLTLTHFLIARAILVPSDWRRTLWISALAAAGPAATIFVVGAGPGGLLAELLPLWCVVAVMAATWTSHVIYGLRRSAIEARKLGQYTLEDRIGEGGMGIVFRARHALLRRRTVVKLLPLEKAGAANLARFEREVQLTSQLGSPNTVAVFDFGRTPAGVFYYAMEYLDGLDLEELVARAGPQPGSRVIHILTQVCSALAEAHDAGLVHRDIKPGNIMLCRHGGNVDVVKVLDFGLVKDLTTTGDVALTQADAFVGTPLYLSPEAITEPARVDARSDLYSVGSVGYFLLTGHPVFAGRTIAELCAQHLYQEPPPMSRRVAGVPADLEALLRSCLDKAPDQRPRDARALQRSLLGCAEAGRWSEADARGWWRAGPGGAAGGAGADTGSGEIASAPTVADVRQVRPG
jgi:eukaryotic-like serine/threonine-protein kinase